MNEEQQTAIDRIFSEWDSPDSPGCALGVVLDGELVYARGYGMSNLEHDIPIAPDSIFHVASVSKQFTAFSIALLAEEGLLALDDDVRKYVPELPSYGPTITIRNFIHHTSGVRDMWDLLRMAGWRQDDLITADDMLDIVPRQKALNFQPGSEHLYSNSGYALLSTIVRRVAGKSLREFADERIFQPLGMTRSHFHDDHTMIVKGRTQAYMPRDGGGYKISIPVFDVDGTTSLFTTVEDLYRWERNFSGRAVGSPAIHEQILTPGELHSGAPMAYAFGLTRRTWRGVEIIEHSGADAGYRSHFLRVPEADAAVICLCNLSTMNPRRLIEQVLDVCLAGRLEPVASLDSPAPAREEIAQWAGIYRNRHTGDLMRFVTGEQGLELGFESMRKLVPAGPNRFALEEDPLVTFTFDTSNGAPTVERGLVYPLGTPQISEVVPPAAPTPAQMNAYTGRYASDELLTWWDLEADGGNLVINRRKFEPRTLLPAGPDCFAADDLRLEFQRDASGMVTGFTANTTRVRGVEFVRE